MNDYEKEIFKNMISSMGEEEQKYAATNIDTDILWDELRKRERQERNMCIAMQSVMSGT